MTDEGKFERNDNNLSDDPYLEFYCTNGREHDYDQRKLWIGKSRLRTDLRSRVCTIGSGVNDEQFDWEYRTKYLFDYHHTGRS